MRKLLIYPALCLLWLVSGGFVGKSRLPEDFIKSLKETGLEFTLKNEDYQETPVIKNFQMGYDYAVKHKTRDFEIRFALRSFASYAKEARDAEKKGDKMANVDNLAQMSFQATVANISGGQFPKYNKFPDDAVKEEFNADWGVVTVCDAGKEFGQDYKHCLVVSIYSKAHTAQAYMFYLTSDKAIFSELFKEDVLHSLKFQ